MYYHMYAPPDYSIQFRRFLLSFAVLLYLFLLVLTAITTQRIDPGVWRKNVHYLRIEATRQCLPSAQNSPTTPHFSQVHGAPEVHNPRALRPVLPIYALHAGLSSEFEIEPYRPYAADRISVDSSSSLPEALPAPVSYPTPAFIYSQHVSRPVPHQMNSPPAPSRLNTSIIYSNRVQPPKPAQQAQASPSSPSPFNWPRADVMEQPVKTRKKTLPSAFEFPRRGAQGPSELPSHPTDPLPHPRTRRPSGPRMRPPSCDETQRPVPL